MKTVATIAEGIKEKDPRSIARAISMVEDGTPEAADLLALLDDSLYEKAYVLGITGPPGVGKSTLTNQLIFSFRKQSRRVGIIAIDPSSPISGGALLGDRIRMMQHAVDADVVVRSMATRGRLGGLCAAAGATARIMAASGCSPIIIETVGVGQSEMDIIRLADITALVLAPGLGDEVQAMKAGLLEVADLMVVNKADCSGAEALALDLETVTRSDTNSQIPVCMTTASDGSGVDELLSVIETIHEEHQHSGVRQSRRQKSRHLEILDWTIELLRPTLMEKIQTVDENNSVDPRAIAKSILAKIFP
jgi:LAO/AO transport system kinase